MGKHTHIVIDAMGGDFGPGPVVEGTVEALRKQAFKATLVGRPADITPLIPEDFKDRIHVLEARDVLGMEENATDVLKREESSIYKAVDLVRTGDADAIVSIGHSGATMTLATLKIGRLKGITRPAIASLMPTEQSRPTLVLDVGANVDCKAENLVQFAVLGEAYVREVMKNEKPRIGLLSNGEEKSKGNEITKEAHIALKSMEGFVGNIEGDNVYDGTVDVIVCDGFVGNILLKATEGLGGAIFNIIRKGVKSSLIARIGALLMRSAFRFLRKQVDYTEYGGAPLLGVKSCTIIGHGKSNAKAVKNAIFQALNYSESKVNERIEARIAQLAP